MVIHGEDSLNEGTEDEGLDTEDEEIEELIRNGDEDEEEYGARESRPGVYDYKPRPDEYVPKLEDNEPSIEQLLATGEISEEEAEQLRQEQENPASASKRQDDKQEKPQEKKPKPESKGEKPKKEPEVTETALAIAELKESGISVRKQVEVALMNGISRHDLEAAGYNSNTIRTIASEIKSKTGSKVSIGRQPSRTPGGMPAFAKGAPPELIVDSIELPDITNGNGPSFESGLKFGLMLSVYGIRMAQELSAMAVTQTKPLLEVAKSMRAGEELAAKTAAAGAAEAAAGEVFESMSPAMRQIIGMIDNLEKKVNFLQGNNNDNPMKGMMMTTMQPVMEQMMSSALGRLLPQLSGNKTQQISTPSMRPASSNAPGWTTKEE